MPPALGKIRDAQGMPLFLLKHLEIQTIKIQKIIRDASSLQIHMSHIHHTWTKYESIP